MSLRGDNQDFGYSEIPADEQLQPVGLDDPAGSALTIQEPPTTMGGIVRRIGPALIITASIVGSGELILTTKTGAVAGMSLMWLILVGCMIKVFVQIEFGRHSISHGITTLQALNSVPGPKFKVRWIVWFWVLMSLATIVQLGGIIGGVGQAMALLVPISGDYRNAIELPSEAELRHYEKWQDLIRKADFGPDPSNQRPPGMPAGPPPGMPGGVPQDGGAGGGDGPRPPGAGGPGGGGGGRPRRPQADDGRPPMAGFPQGLPNFAATLHSVSFSPLQTAQDEPTAQEDGDQSEGNKVEAAKSEDSKPSDAVRQEAQPAASQRQGDEDNEDQPTRSRRGNQGRNQDDNDNGGGAAAPFLPPPPDEPPPPAVGPPLGDPEKDEFLSKSSEEQGRLRKSVEMMRTRLRELGQRGSEARTAVAELMRYEQDLEVELVREGATESSRADIERQIAEVRAEVKGMLAPWTWDDKYWALMVALITIAILYQGRYMVVQNVSTFLVVVFTFVSIGNVLALQSFSDYALSWDDFAKGFGIPKEGNGLFMALATLGIIGVGAAELVAYPYWCLEKGYARFTGPRTADDSWVRRAKGWIRVMKYDAFLSLVIYTVATMAFYVMGATVLHRSGLNPDGQRMVATLAEQYVPVFGRYALPIFIAGAVAVLYSTVVAAVAGHSRTFTDCFKLFGLVKYHDEASHKRSVAGVCIVVPLIGLLVYCIPGANPVTLVIGGAVMQAVMLPLLAFAALYLRFRQTDARICPGGLWDVLLIVSCLGLLASGAGAVWTAIVEWSK